MQTSEKTEKKYSFRGFFSTKTVQWNLDLRKILGVTKIFLKSRFFLISNTRKPLKKHNSAKWTSETIQISYCFNIVKCFWLYLWIFSYLLIKIRKIGKCGNIFLKTLKICFFFWNCSKIVKKSLFFNIFEKFSYLNRTLGLQKSF